MCVILQRKPKAGGLAQLARALAWHARGHRFDSDILHENTRWAVAKRLPIRRFEIKPVGSKAQV